MPPQDDPKQTISVQLDSQFYNRFVRFCFKTEITKSDAIRMGLEILMGAESFLANKGKEKEKNGQY